MEDLDPPREVPGAADQILRSLERLGLEWDGAVLYQSARQEHYRAALERLDTLGVLYPCGCSRRDIAAIARLGAEGWIYPGTCRGRPSSPQGHNALRVLTRNDPIEFHDAVQGVCRQRLEESVGDFVVKRADGLIAYQLAVVVDDAAQEISEVVRGSDLLDSTAKQIHLQRLLEYPTPDYLHLPVATNPQGEKLSKQSGAAPLDEDAGTAALIDALTFLGQAVNTDLRQARPSELLAWATKHWDAARIPRVPAKMWPAAMRG